MAEAPRDQNFVPTTLFESSTTPGLTLSGKINQSTGRVLVDSSGGGGGTVTSVSVVTDNGFAGSVATATTTPTITLSTTITGILSGNGTAISAASTTGSGAIVLANTPTLITPILGAATATSINGLIISTTTGTFTLTNAKTLSVSNTLTLAGTDGKTLTISNSGTLAGGDAFVLAIAAGKTLTVSNSITLAGTDSTVMTFPTTSKTIAANDGTNWAIASQAIGDIPTASSSSAYTRLAAVAVGSVLVSAGTGTQPVWSAGPQVTTIELGSATDTTLSRSSAGVMAVEGVVVDTISAANTLTNKTLTSPIIQTSPVLAAATNLKYTVASSDSTATGDITNEFNSGYSSTAVGDLVYLDASATWQKADADASVTTFSSMLGIALAVAASGAPVAVLLRGFIYAATPFPTFTIGLPIYMSATAGAVTQTAPVTTDSATRIIGYAVHADKMWFCPSNDWITHT